MKKIIILLSFISLYSCKTTDLNNETLFVGEIVNDDINNGCIYFIYSNKEFTKFKGRAFGNCNRFQVGDTFTFKLK